MFSLLLVDLIYNDLIVVRVNSKEEFEIYMNNKIFILLPHKEKFSKKNSGSASIWTRDFYKLSRNYLIESAHFARPELINAADKVYEELVGEPAAT